jgi:hypothetical protein
MLTVPARINRTLEPRVTVLAEFGLMDDAFAMADRWTRVMGGWSTPQFLFPPDASALRRDRRFIALATKIGLVDYWRSTGKWPDFCADPMLPYSCVKEAERLAGAR